MFNHWVRPLIWLVICVMSSCTLIYSPTLLKLVEGEPVAISSQLSQDIFHQRGRGRFQNMYMYRVLPHKTRDLRACRLHTNAIALIYSLKFHHYIFMTVIMCVTQTDFFLVSLRFSHWSTKMLRNPLRIPEWFRLHRQWPWRPLQFNKLYLISHVIIYHH